MSASPNNTSVTVAVVDSSGNIWSINAAGVVCVNYVADTTTKNVVGLAYVNGQVWQQAWIPASSQLLWWYKTSPKAAWLPTAGTSASPLPSIPSAPTGVQAS